MNEDRILVIVAGQRPLRIIHDGRKGRFERAVFEVVGINGNGGTNKLPSFLLRCKLMEIYIVTNRQARRTSETHMKQRE